LVITAYVFFAASFIKRERLQREQLRESIRSLCDDLRLAGDYTIDDFDLLYELDELERIIQLLQAQPAGRRKLQFAVDVLEKEEKAHAKAHS
jgi:hypothetical protein